MNHARPVAGDRLVNGVFAMSELAVMTARKIRLEQRAEEGDTGAQAALELTLDPTQFLSTVQDGITLIGVLAGAFGGASIAGQLAATFSRRISQPSGWPHPERAVPSLTSSAVPSPTSSR